MPEKKKKSKFMKSKVSIYLKFVLLLLLVCSSNLIFSQYKISQIIEESKVKIPYPYKYDGFSMTEFSFDLLNKKSLLNFLLSKDRNINYFFALQPLKSPLLYAFMINLHQK